MIRLVAALPAEARPLIRHYGLQRQPGQTDFPVYQRGELALTVAGVGKTSAAAATDYLHRRAGSEPHAGWLNIGIAGHRSHPVGSGFLVHRIADHAGGRTFYPPFALRTRLRREALVTVDRPAGGYPDSGLVDMEASGFYATASRFASREIVQCFKVVSDNPRTPADTITARGVSELIGGQLAIIDAIVTEIRNLSAQLRERRRTHAELARFARRWHFTVSQQHRLRGLLRRWRALAPHQPVWSGELERLPRAGDVLRVLQHRVDALPIEFGTPRP